MTEKDIAIRVANLSKCFQIYDRPQNRLKQSLYPRLQKLARRQPKIYHRDFWALKDISLEIKKGETVGIIGRNGSGKSTLLQIICGTLAPTEGILQTNGRIAALLELGAGFNSEFTGRENVYLNGAVIGLSRSEIDTRFDSIAAFADIDGFIDQPVKTYSSGMVVRLAFAVAINVDPQILVVDEALSVGDELFQRKCFSRIEAIKNNGATILFVSHSGSTVVELCDEALLLDQGEMILRGQPKSVISQYQKLLFAPTEKYQKIKNELKENGVPDKRPTSEEIPDKDSTENSTADTILAYFDDRIVTDSIVTYESRGASIHSPCLTTLEGTKVNVLARGAEYIYSYDIDFSSVAHKVRFGMLIKTVSGYELGGFTSSTSSNKIKVIEAATRIKVAFRFRCLLTEGAYFLNAGVYGSIDEAEVYLARCVDLFMFKVMPESEPQVTGNVDFCIEPQIAVEQQSI